MIIIIIIIIIINELVDYSNSLYVSKRIQRLGHSSQILKIRMQNFIK